MTEFSIRLADRPGQLASLTRLFSDAGVEIEALAAVADSGSTLIRIVVERGLRVRRLLMSASINFEEREVLDTFVPRGKSGLASITKSLANAGVNIDSLYLLHTDAEGFHLALTVSDNIAAEQALAG